MIKTKLKKAPVSDSVIAVASKCFKIRANTISQDIEGLIGSYMKFVEYNNGHRPLKPKSEGIYSSLRYGERSRYDRQKDVIGFLQNNEHCSVTYMATNLTMSANTVRDVLKTLVTAGVVKSSVKTIRGNKYTVYYLLEGSEEYDNFIVDLMLSS